MSKDQYEHRMKDRLPNTRERVEFSKLYCGGTLFNNNTSSKIDVYQQVSFGVSDIIRSKELYE